MNSDYDGVYLIPKGVSYVPSRDGVSLKDQYGLYPIISSPMKGISGKDLVIEMGKNNYLGILHRFDTLETRQSNIVAISKANVCYGVAIGVNNWDEEFAIAKYAVDFGASVLCLDLANGYLSFLKDYGEILRKEFGQDIRLMCGNVITKEGAKHLKDSGFNMVRVGIGSGELCITRKITGVGRNQLMAIKECSEIDVEIVADGGIDSSDKMTKAIFVGADYLMVGSALGYALEAENDGSIYGMASLKNHINNNKQIKSIEGIEKTIDNNQKKPLKEILGQFLWGIRSCGTYLNCNSYQEIPHKSRMIREFE